MSMPMSTSTSTPHEWASPELHQKIREQFDPTAGLLSDDDIQKIIHMHYGNEPSIIRQCLLGLSVHAEVAGRMTDAVRFRRQLFAFEAGTFSLSAAADMVDAVDVVDEVDEVDEVDDGASD